MIQEGDLDTCSEASDDSHNSSQESEDTLHSSEASEIDMLQDEEPAMDMVQPQGIPRVAQEPQHGVLHARLVQLLESLSLAKQGYDDGTELEGKEEDEMEPTGWATAANKRLTSMVPNSAPVRDYVYRELGKLKNTVKSRDSANKDLYDNAHYQFESLPPPDPEGHLNCWPPSLDACESVLNVPELSKYRIHLCPKGCIHWWTHSPTASQCFHNCPKGPAGCDQCRCPHCKSHRFVKGKQGVVGAQTCWLFLDAIQDMFLDPDWANAVMKAQAMRDNEDEEGHDGLAGKPSFARYKEYARLCTVLPEHGYDMSKVCLFFIPGICSCYTRGSCAMSALCSTTVQENPESCMKGERMPKSLSILTTYNIPLV